MKVYFDGEWYAIKVGGVLTLLGDDYAPSEWDNVVRVDDGSLDPAPMGLGVAETD
jgi:hypothetical protein